MKPSIWDKQLGLGSPLECAAIPSGQTKNPSKNETGWMQVTTSTLESVRLNFLAPAFHRSRDRHIVEETTFDCAARLLAGARGARQLAFLSGRESQFHCRRCWAFPAWNMSPHWDTACGRRPRA